MARLSRYRNLSTPNGYLRLGTGPFRAVPRYGASDASSGRKPATSETQRCISIPTPKTYIDVNKQTAYTIQPERAYYLHRQDNSNIPHLLIFKSVTAVCVFTNSLPGPESQRVKKKLRPH